MATTLTHGHHHSLLDGNAQSRLLASWHAHDTRWRLLAVTTDTPVVLGLEWTTPDGPAQSVQVSVARSARICVLATSVTLRATNLGSEGTTVQVVAGDAYEKTSNVLEVSGIGLGSVQPVALPAQAERVWLEVVDPSQLPACQLRLKEVGGEVSMVQTGEALSTWGVRLGAAQSVEVVVPQDLRWRLIFGLSL